MTLRAAILKKLSFNVDFPHISLIVFFMIFLIRVKYNFKNNETKAP